MTGLLLAAGGLALLPVPALEVTRMRVLLGGSRRRGSGWRAVRPAGVGVALPAGAGAVVLGGWSHLGFGAAVPVLPAVAGAVAAATAAAVAGRVVADRRRRRAASALLESVGALAADLRAGQSPADALATAGAGPAAGHRAVSAVWTVSERSGASAAAVLDRVEEDLRIRVSQQREIESQLAGARSTAVLLAVLPVLGIGLGAAMGATPLAVLLGAGRGQVALVAGVVLDAVGVLWTSRIVAAAAARFR